MADPDDVLKRIPVLRSDRAQVTRLGGLSNTSYRVDGPSGRFVLRLPAADPGPFVDRANEIAAARGVPAAQLALAWVMQRPGVTAPIVGATKVGHLEDALAAEQLELGGDEVARLEELYVPHAVSGHSA